MQARLPLFVPIDTSAPSSWKRRRKAFCRIFRGPSGKWRLTATRKRGRLSPSREAHMRMFFDDQNVSHSGLSCRICAFNPALTLIAL
jgi:hypothetical protein